MSQQQQQLSSQTSSSTAPSNVTAENAKADDLEQQLAQMNCGLDQPINLVLRIRNQKKELNDIRFEFTVNKGWFVLVPCSICLICKHVCFRTLPDTADGIANELITAGLVDGKDFTPMAQNLQRLIQERAKIKNVVFQLVSASLCVFVCLFCSLSLFSPCCSCRRTRTTSWTRRP